MKKEDLKVGMKLRHVRDDTSVERSVIAQGKKSLIASYGEGYEFLIDYDELENYEPVKATKRYWLWDVEDFEKEVYKDPYYMNDIGECVKGTSRVFRNNITLIKKHEDEYIDIEEE